MERVQEGTKEGLKESHLRQIALRLASRGVDIWRLTFGEILYMENEARERDQINWACSAQNEKLLPKKKATNNKQAVARAIEARVGSIFSAYERDHK